MKVVYLVSTLAKIFPPMREPEYARLKGSIRQAGAPGAHRDVAGSHH